jgi:hypothetical protein
MSLIPTESKNSISKRGGEDHDVAVPGAPNVQTITYFINQIVLNIMKNRIDQYNVCLNGRISNTLNKVLSVNLLNENTLLKGNISINVTNYVFFTFQRI